MRMRRPPFDRARVAEQELLGRRQARMFEVERHAVLAALRLAVQHALVHLDADGGGAERGARQQDGPEC